jgi:hypothetical protein
MTEDTDLDKFEIDPQGDLPPLPEGAPDDFYARLSLALKTTNADVLVGAAQTFCGVYKSALDYVCTSIGYELPVHLEWLPLFLLEHGGSALIGAYEQGKAVVWVVPVDEDRVMVFEALRWGVGEYTVPVASERVTVYLERGDDE